METSHNRPPTPQEIKMFSESAERYMRSIRKNPEGFEIEAIEPEDELELIGFEFRLDSGVAHRGIFQDRNDSWFFSIPDIGMRGRPALRELGLSDDYIDGLFHSVEAIRKAKESKQILRQARRDPYWALEVDSYITGSNDNTEGVGVYIVSTMDRFVKIGKTNDGPTKRIYSLKTGCPTELKLEAWIPCDSAKKAHELESNAHKIFSEIRVRGEWFTLTKPMREFIGDINEAINSKGGER